MAKPDTPRGDLAERWLRREIGTEEFIDAAWEEATSAAQEEISRQIYKPVAAPLVDLVKDLAGSLLYAWGRLKHGIGVALTVVLVIALLMVSAYLYVRFPLVRQMTFWLVVAGAVAAVIVALVAKAKSRRRF